LSQRHDRPDDDEEEVIHVTDRKSAFGMPELMHNLNLLVDMCEDDIVQNDKK